MKTGMARVVSYEESSLFTPDIGRLMQPANRWFRIDEFHLMSQFMDYEFTLSDERHSFDFELDADLVDTYEVHLYTTITSLDMYPHCRYGNQGTSP